MISAIATFHRERHLARATLKSLELAVSEARRRGTPVEILLIADRPDAETWALLTEAKPADAELHRVDFGDQSLSRNHGGQLARGDWAALLDGDDLWTSGWLADALDFALACPDPARSIIHPEYNRIFGGENALVRQPDQTAADFDMRAMRFANPWDALCFAPISALRDVPYAPRDAAAGWGYEDWGWNLATIKAGYLHRVLPGSFIFKRRHAGGASLVDRRRGSWHRCG